MHDSHDLTGDRMDMAMDQIHVPVMLETVLELLEPALTRPDAYFIDCTLGMGGHTEAVLQRFPNAQCLGIDRDPQALDIASRRLAPFGDRMKFAQVVFDEFEDVIECAPTAILADLGLSSLQIDQRERGFAYSMDAPLDMRMGTEGPTAADIVNTYPPGDLIRILHEFGEERNARRIVRAIVSAREEARIESSGRLVDVISHAVPPTRPGHPAKRTFQAIRIEVNRELAALDGLLPQALDSLAGGGRFAVLSYHSLEDRRVKRAFRSASSDQVPKRLPIVPDEYKAKFQLVTNKAGRPTPEEVAQNPRAASARLRVIERRTA